MPRPVSSYDSGRLDALLNRPDVRTALLSSTPSRAASLSSLSQYDRELLARHATSLRPAAAARHAAARPKGSRSPQPFAPSLTLSM